MSSITPTAVWYPFNLKDHNLKSGFYWWRMQNKHVPDLTMNFIAKLRIRGNGNKPNILSPSFDSWDGWNVLLPKCEYGFIEELPDDVTDFSHIHIEGLDPLPCPFCGKVPVIKGNFFFKEGGTLCDVNPYIYNSWKFQCCKWFSRDYWWSDPRHIEIARRETFKKIQGMNL